MPFYAFTFKGHKLYPKVGERILTDLNEHAIKLRLSGIPLDKALEDTRKCFCEYSDPSLCLNIFDVDSAVYEAFHKLPVLNNHSELLLNFQEELNVFPIGKDSIIAIIDTYGDSKNVCSILRN